MFLKKYNISRKRYIVDSEMEVAVMLSTVLVGGAFVAILALKWKFYSDYYKKRTKMV